MTIKDPSCKDVATLEVEMKKTDRLGVKFNSIQWTGDIFIHFKISWKGPLPESVSDYYLQYEMWDSELKNTKGQRAQEVNFDETTLRKTYFLRVKGFTGNKPRTCISAIIP